MFFELNIVSDITAVKFFITLGPDSGNPYCRRLTKGAWKSSPMLLTRDRKYGSTYFSPGVNLITLFTNVIYKRA